MQLASAYTAAAMMVFAVTLIAPPARASVIHVQMSAYDPAQNPDAPSFGGLSFDVDTAATVDTITTGSCGAGTTPGVYEAMTANGGVSNGSMAWKGVDYTLDSASFYLEEDSNSCSFYLNMTLSFGPNAMFGTQDLPAGGAYSYADYTPSQLLADKLVTGYNDKIGLHGYLVIDGSQVGLDAFDTTASTVPEPHSLALFGAGLLGLAWSQRRKLVRMAH